jgi:FKBP-type peptidyl-prolyl cis-trans isomerase
MRALAFRGAILAATIGLAAGCEGEKKVTPNGIRYLDLVEGEGQPAKIGDALYFTYVGYLGDGIQFERHDRTNPIGIRLGWNQSIAGLDEGLENIKAGGKRKIWIPARMAYGVAGSPPKVPPNADLIFEVEILDVATPEQVRSKNEILTKEMNENAKEAKESEKKAAKLQADENKPATWRDVAPDDRKEIVTPSGLKYTDERIGEGKLAENGHRVAVLYVGRFTDGKKFDSNQNSSHPFVFRLGNGEVIKGWDEGIAGMKAGGKRKLVVPPGLAYGPGGAGGGQIPPNATLLFDVELLKVQ